MKDMIENAIGSMTDEERAKLQDEQTGEQMTDATLRMSDVMLSLACYYAQSLNMPVNPLTTAVLGHSMYLAALKMLHTSRQLDRESLVKILDAFVADTKKGA